MTGSSFVIPSPQKTGHATVAAASGDSVSHVPRERWDMHSFWDIYLDYEAASAVVTPFGGFIDRADLKLFIGPPGLRARFEILRSCFAELVRAGIVTPPPDRRAPYIAAFAALPEPARASAAAAAAASASLVSLLEHAARNSAAKTTPNPFALSVTFFIMFDLPQSLEPKTCLM